MKISIIRTIKASIETFMRKVPETIMFHFGKFNWLKLRHGTKFADVNNSLSKETCLQSASFEDLSDWVFFAPYFVASPAELELEMR